jgi:queuine/archaeosine tRNA-ribosyltransferase
MSFTDYGVSPDNLNDFWRTETFHERFEKLDAPVFIDSGGFKLMNSDTFGKAPSEGGIKNEWGLYTDAKSILGLQVDFGGDIVATLDYPIPPDLNENEQFDRMERSIESAVEYLRLLDEPARLAESFELNEKAADRLAKQVQSGDEPGLYVAIHGHDYETINWYVGTFLDRVTEESVGSSFEGFAIGSLVPLRSSIDVLVDIVQGAKDAIPENQPDEVGLHVFGIGGKQVSLLALLGVDSFDCSSHVQAAQYQKYIHPETWERHKIKSDYYAELARHNFEVYSAEMEDVRTEIENGDLLEYVIEFAREHDDIAKGLEYAQRRDKRLREAVEIKGAYDLLPGPEVTSDQTKLSEWGGGVEETTRSISLEYGPESFNVLRREYEPPAGIDTLLVIPCSQKKPYSESQTHQVLWDKLGSRTESLQKVTVSGMYGPVPEEYETEEPVMSYEYVLAKEDERQIKTVTTRLTEFLEHHGDAFDYIVGYVTSKTYRWAVEDAFEAYGRGEVLPRDPQALQLSEYFRQSNVDELLSYLDSREYGTASEH